MTAPGTVDVYADCKAYSPTEAGQPWTSNGDDRSISFRVPKVERFHGSKRAPGRGHSTVRAVEVADRVRASVRRDTWTLRAIPAFGVTLRDRGIGDMGASNDCVPGSEASRLPWISIGLAVALTPAAWVRPGEAHDRLVVADGGVDHRTPRGDQPSPVAPSVDAEELPTHRMEPARENLGNAMRRLHLHLVVRRLLPGQALSAS